MEHRISSLRKNEFFSFVMNAIVAAILVMGNSSYTFITKGQSIDSLRPNVGFNETTNDNIKSPTISIPSKKMIRHADNEINRSMKDHIKMINSLRIADFESRDGDNSVTKQFFDSFLISIINSNHVIDEYIERSFNAENILFESNEAIKKADNEMNQGFNTEFRLNPIKGSILSIADNTMNMNFHDEH